MTKKIGFISCFIILLGGACLVGVTFLGGFWMYFRPQPADTTLTLFPGVVYQRDARQQPRPMVIHVARVDLGTNGIEIFVTPGDPKADLPLEAKTTSSFLKQFNLQIAVNGDGFEPWYSRSILDYYPRSGDPVDVIGQAVSNGVRYSDPTDSEPTLFFTGNNNARINFAPGKTKQAISGNQTLLQQGQNLASDDSSPEPRTAVGLDKRRRELIIVVVDGRQPGYSEGATLMEMAGIMQSLGAHEAINLDGGGSSTLVTQGSNGKAEVLNSPINHGIPGLERPVGNHLGIYALP